MRLSRSGRLSASFALALALTAALSLTGPSLPLAGAIAPLAQLAGPTAAAAATYAQVSCSANGSPAPIDGWTSTGAGNSSGAVNNCASGGFFGVGVSGATPQPAGENLLYSYTPPPWATIAGGTLTGILVVPYGQGGQAYFAAPASTYDPSDVIANCQWNLPCPQNAPAPGPGAYSATFPITPGGNVYMVASCAGLPGGAGCPGGYGSPATAAAVLTGATIELSTSATPSAAGFAGGVLTPGPVSGTQPLTFTATEANGPGIASVSVSVDSTPVFNGPIDTNGGKCVKVGTDPAGFPEYLWQAPCRQSVAADIPVDTTRFGDGGHQLHVSVTDAAGNTAQVLNQPFTTANRSKVSAQLDGSLPAPGTPGGPAAPVYALVLDPATQALVHGVQHGYANSGLDLSGTIRNSAGVPAPGVPLALLAQNGGVGDAHSIARTVSDAAGHWTLTAPPGPSRVLTITYGTEAQAKAAQAAGVAINETVTPGLSLHIKTLGRGRLRFTGKLAVEPLGNPRPTVLIQALVRKHWQAVGNAVTVSATGTYKLIYSAGRTPLPKYPFRARSIATSLYTAATSATRTTVVR